MENLTGSRVAGGQGVGVVGTEDPAPVGEGLFVERDRPAQVAGPLVGAGEVATAGQGTSASCRLRVPAILAPRRRRPRASACRSSVSSAVRMAEAGMDRVRPHWSASRGSEEPFPTRSICVPDLAAATNRATHLLPASVTNSSELDVASTRCHYLSIVPP